MIKIMFVCHGNICRSPMAEFVLKDMVKKADREYKLLLPKSQWTGANPPVIPGFFP